MSAGHPGTATWFVDAGTYTVSVTTSPKGTTYFTQQVNVSTCTLALTSVCSSPGTATGKVLATITNPGTVDLDLTVTLDGPDPDPSQALHVAAGGSALATFNNVPAGTYTVKAVTSDNKVKLEKTIDVSQCQIGVTTVCSSSNEPTGKVTVTVDGSAPSFTVTLDGANPQVLSASGTPSYTYTGVAAGSHTVSTTPEGGNPIDQVVDVSTCTLQLSAVCSSATTGVVSVTLSTTSINPTDFIVTLDGANQQIVEDVVSGTPVTITYTGVAAGTHSVEATPTGGAAITGSVSVQGCNTTITSVCSSVNTGTVKVIVANDGPNPVDIVVKLDDGTETLFGGVTNATPIANRTIEYPGVSAGPHTVTTKFGNEAPFVQEIQVAGCQPRLTGTPLCKEVDVTNKVTTYNFTLTNPEPIALPVTFEGGSATIPANGSVNIKTLTAPIHATFLQQLLLTLNASEEILWHRCEVREEAHRAAADG